MALQVSKKNIVKIDVFMENFLGVKFDGEEKLTHTVMRDFLLEKGYTCPRRAIFSKIKKEDILCGKYIVVKDETCQKIAYYNPGASFNKIIRELKQELDPGKLEKARADILKEQGYLLQTNGDIVALEQEDTIEYVERTRDKKFVYSSRTRITPVRRK